MQTHRYKSIACFGFNHVNARAWSPYLIAALGLLSQLPCHASELSIESRVDQSPTELKKLNDQALVLEKRIKELEQRISVEQAKVLAPEKKDHIELDLSLSPDRTVDEDKRPQRYLISHLRMSLNGRPFVFNQSALLATSEVPLPLYLGLIRPGKHLVRIQFQAALYDDLLVNHTALPWQKVDNTLTLEVVEDKTPVMEKRVLITSRAGWLSVDLK